MGCCGRSGLGHITTGSDVKGVSVDGLVCSGMSCARGFESCSLELNSVFKGVFTPHLLILVVITSSVILFHKSANDFVYTYIEQRVRNEEYLHKSTQRYTSQNVISSPLKTMTLAP